MVARGAAADADEDADARAGAGAGAETLKKPACMADATKSSCLPRSLGAKANSGPDAALRAAEAGRDALDPGAVAAAEAAAAAVHACSSPLSRNMASTACSTLVHTK